MTFQDLDSNHSGKRSRQMYETYYQQAEAAEDLAVLSQIRQKEKGMESQGSTSTAQGIDRGAEGPVPPKPI